MILLAIDPGKSTGWARFQDGVLEAAGVFSVTDGAFEWCDTLVIEIPIYRPKSRVSPNDLITLAFTTGQLAERVPYGNLVKVLPATWKGSVPKKIHQERVLLKLSKQELSVLHHRDHNMVDAIGIGLWYLKR